MNQYTTLRLATSAVIRNSPSTLSCSRAIVVTLLLYLTTALPAFAAPRSSPTSHPDFSIPHGHFYTEANGLPPGNTSEGFGITNDQGIPFWSTYQHWGGAPVLGYPISGRFISKGFIEQATQRAILQWRPAIEQVVFVNILDELSAAGKNHWLTIYAQIPKPVPENMLPDPGAPSAVRHLALLKQNPVIAHAYMSTAHAQQLYGLPTSPPVSFGIVTVLRCQRTALQLWQKATPWSQPGQITVVAAGDLAKKAGLIPSAALIPQKTPRLEGEASKLPWSGWWWPASLIPYQPPYLFDSNGPLAKYDQYVASLGLPDPHVRLWEMQHIEFDNAALFWAGHCNGWAAAALLEPEPTTPHTIHGITFSIADQKGLLSDYHFADTPLWIYGSFTQPLNPADLQRVVINWLGQRHLGFIIDDIASPQEVQSYPVYRFRLIYTTDPEHPNITHVRLTLWMASYHVNPNITGLVPYPGSAGQEFDYWITGPLTNPTSGGWEGKSLQGPHGHPQLIWYPNPSVRNTGQLLTDPQLSYPMLLQILGRPASQEAQPPNVPLP